MVASIAELNVALARYKEALEQKGGQELVEADEWYRNELRKLVRQRHASSSPSERGAYITHDEMVRLIKWKLKRGKFRPALESFVRSNAEELVYSSTNEALSTILTTSEGEDTEVPDEETIKKAMKAACQMKGVGPALSSAILALALPTFLPYMSDELYTLGVGIKVAPKYSEKEYVCLVEKVTERMRSERAKKVNKDAPCLLDAEQFEKASWAFSVLSNDDEKEKKTKKRDGSSVASSSGGGSVAKEEKVKATTTDGKRRRKS